MRNFRSYGDDTTTLEFKPGLNVLLGRIGSGKSSVLEAILICLFGFNRSGTRKKDVLRTNATSNDFQIELTFFFDDTHFKLARGNEIRLESSPDGNSWTLVSENSHEINDFIQSTLEVSAKKFRDLFYSAQGELTKVITGSPEERQKSIDKLLGAESLRETYEYLSEYVKYFDQDIGSAKGRLSELKSYLKRVDLDELRDQKREEQRGVIEISDSIESLGNEISSLSSQLKEARSDLKPLEEANKQIQELKALISEKRSDLKARRGRVEELEESLEEIRENESQTRSKMEELRPKIDELQQRKERVESEFEDLNQKKSRASSLLEKKNNLEKNISTLKRNLEQEASQEETLAQRKKKVQARIANLQEKKEDKLQRIGSLEEAIEDLREKVSEKERDIRESEIRSRTLKQKILEIGDRIDELDSLSKGAKCPFCEQVITAEHRSKVSSRLRDQLKSLTRERKSQESSAKQLREELESLEETAKSSSRELDQAKEDLTTLRTGLARLDQEKSNLSQNLEDCRGRKESHESDLEEQEKSLRNTENRLQEIRSGLDIVSDDWVQVLNSRTEELSQQVNELRNDLSSCRAQVESCQSMLERQKRQKRRQLELREENGEAISKLESEIASADGQLKSAYEPLIGSTQQPVVELTRRIDHLKERIDTLNDGIREKEVKKARLSSQFKQKEDKISQLAQDIEEYLRDKKKAQEAKREYTIYSEAKNILQQIRDKYKDAREMIRTDLINVLRETLRREFNRLYTYEDFHDVEVSDDYQISLLSPSLGEISAHNLSAGQKAIVAIAFRLAVAKAMEMRIGCWIIDEPTQNIGESEVEKLGDVLADTEEIPQIIVASHHPSLGRHGNVINLELEGGKTIRDEVDIGYQPTEAT